MPANPSPHQETPEKSRSHPASPSSAFAKKLCKVWAALQAAFLATLRFIRTIPQRFQETAHDLPSSSASDTPLPASPSLPQRGQNKVPTWDDLLKLFLATLLKIVGLIVEFVEIIIKYPILLIVVVIWFVWYWIRSHLPKWPPGWLVHLVQVIREWILCHLPKWPPEWFVHLVQVIREWILCHLPKWPPEWFVHLVQVIREWILCHLPKWPPEWFVHLVQVIRERIVVAIVDTLVHVAQFIWNVVLHRIVDAMVSVAKAVGAFVQRRIIDSMVHILQALWTWIVHVILHGLQGLGNWFLRIVWSRLPHWGGHTGMAWAGHSIADGVASVAQGLGSGAQALSHGAAQVGHVVAGTSAAALHALGDGVDGLGYGLVGIGHGMATMPSFAILFLPNEMSDYFYSLEVIIIWIVIIGGISIILENIWCRIIAICVVLWPDTVAYITAYAAQALWHFVQRLVDLMQALWSVVPDPIASAIAHAIHYLLHWIIDVVRYINLVTIRDPSSLLPFVWHMIVNTIIDMIQTWHRMRDQIVSGVAHSIIHGLQSLRHWFPDIVWRRLPHWGGNTGMAWAGHSIADGVASVAHGLGSGAQELSHGAAQVGHVIVGTSFAALHALGDGVDGLGYGPVGIGHGMAMMPSFAAQTLTHPQGYWVEVIVLGVGTMMGIGIGIVLQMALQKIGWKGMVIGAIIVIGITIGVGAVLKNILTCENIASFLICLGTAEELG